jgi:glycosyltransferase involved in cell wall biosynthesis
MKSLRVLHVDPERGFSGGETQVMALLGYLRRFGHHNELAARPEGELARRAAADGFAVHALACGGSHDPRAGLRLRALARGLDADVVHMHTGRALSLAPYLSRAALRVVTRRMDYAPRGAGRYVRWLYGQVDAVIAISRAAADALRGRGIATPIEIVPSGVDVERFAPADEALRAAARTALRLDPAEPVLAMIASLHTRKGHDVLLDGLTVLAARGLRPACLLAGTGPERERLEARGEASGLAAQLRWLGRIDDVRSLLAAADVAVLPSLAEGLGVAALEALAVGRPLVASAVGGLREVVRHDVDGLLVPPADPAALAEAIARCLGDRALAARLAAAGPRRALDFSTMAMARGTESVYERALIQRGMLRPAPVDSAQPDE